MVRISRRAIEDAIDRAEIDFRWCTKLLSTTPERSPEFSREDILAFQSRLTAALTKIDVVYRTVATEKAATIARKAQLSRSWFTAHLRRLDAYGSALKKCMGIGRTIGDGFAWIFYRDEYNLLDEHLKHQRQPLLPPGLGGIGERLFVEQVPVLNGHFVIYHGLTSILRMGNISLYDFATGRIVAIGELKTEKLDDAHLRLSVGFVWSATSSPFEDLPRSDGQRLSPPLESKMRRQISQLTEALQRVERRASDPTLAVAGSFHHDALQRVCSEAGTKRLSYQQAGASLLLAAVRTRGHPNLSKKLLPARNERVPHLDDAPHQVMKIMDTSARDNALFVGHLGIDDDYFPKTMPGTVPFFWWPVDNVTRDHLLFCSLSVFTFYNPAPLWQILRKSGYEISVDHRSRAHRASKKLNERLVVLENLSYFQQLSQHFLMSDDAVVRMINLCANDRNLPESRTRVQIAPRLRF